MPYLLDPNSRRWSSLDPDFGSLRTSFARPMTNLFAYRYGGGATFSERYPKTGP